MPEQEIDNDKVDGFPTFTNSVQHFAAIRKTVEASGLR